MPQSVRAGTAPWSTRSRLRFLEPIRLVAKGRWRRLVALACSSYVSGLIEAMFLVIITKTAFAVSEGSGRVDLVAGRTATQTNTLIFAACLIGLRAALNVLASHHSAELMAGVVADTRRQLLAAFVQAPWSMQNKQDRGTLHELMTSFSNQSSVMIQGVASLIATGASLFALVGLAAFVDPAGASLLLVTVVFLGLILRPARLILANRSRRSSEAGLAFANAVSEVSTLGMELHVFDVHDEAAEQVETTIDLVENRARSVHFVAGLINPLYSSVAFIALIAALGFVSRSSTTDIESLGAVMLLMIRSLNYGQAMQRAAAGVSAAAPWIEEIQSRLNTFAVDKRPTGGEPVKRVKGLDIIDLSFSYGDGVDALRDVSFRLEPCEIVGVVGPSGSGKSTLVQLLLGLRSPMAGTIMTGGRAISELSKSDWARRVTFVPQDALLIAGTIAENIAFFRPDVSQAEIEQAARAAHIHDDIMSFAEGYERVVGRDGSQLSGGQRQRVSLARALVESPDVIVLDEPTSALDPKSEQMVRQTLRELGKKTTVVIIAHRISTLDICDRIMVIEDGQLNGFAEPSELAESNKFFSDSRALSEWTS